MPRPMLCLACSLLLFAPLTAEAQSLVAQSAEAQSPDAAKAQQATKIECSDVALSQHGVLSGQLADAQGKPIAGAKVWLIDGRNQPVATETNEAGRFGYKDLRPGVYSLQTGDAVRVCRVWNDKAAPPKSLPGVLLIADENAVRAQTGPPPMLNGFVQHSKRFFAHPVGMVAIGAAIATPIAIVAADDDDPASP